MMQADWVVVKITVEEDLALDSRARSILASDDHAAVARLCADLLRAYFMHTRLIQQATRRIAELEHMHFMQTQRAKRRRWFFLF